MKYQVAYPNPSLRPADRLCLCSIDSQTNRRDLLSQLCKKYPGHTNDLKRATFWKVIDIKGEDVLSDSMQKVYDWVREKDGGTEIPRSGPIARLFPDGPLDESEKRVDIVVVTPKIIEAMWGNGAAEPRYMKARENITRIMKRAPSPSESVESAAAVKRVVLDRGGPRYGRPVRRFGPPTALFSKPLALLKYDLEHLESFTPDPTTLNRAFSLIVGATDFFVDESKREASLKPVLQGLLMGQNKWREQSADQTTKSCGVWLEGHFGYLIVTLKNEPGLGGDPFLQGLLMYGKIITQEKYASYLKQSNVPVILLAMAGNNLVISTAIFTNAIYADELLSIELHLGTHGPANILHIARVSMAINKTARQLHELYRGLLVDPLSQTGALWPNPTVDPPQSTERLPELEFFSRVNRADGTEVFLVDENNEGHAIYLARMRTGTSDNRDVVFVKFAVNYHEGAHRLLAEQNPPLAPTLYFCARVIGDMYMVVMEYIPRSRGRDLRSITRGSSPLKPTPEVVRRDVTKALGLLHEQNLVFGDLQEENLLYLPEDGGRVLLVDFDDVGRDGEDRYSACLDHAVGSALGVDKWQIMKMAHDVRNLNRLMEPSGWMSRNAR